MDFQTVFLLILMIFLVPLLEVRYLPLNRTGLANPRLASRIMLFGCFHAGLEVFFVMNLGGCGTLLTQFIMYHMWWVAGSTE